MSNTWEDIDTGILKGIAEGNERAFRQVYDLYKGKLFTFACYLTQSRVEAEEIVQEVFTSLWERRGTVLAIEHPGRYLYVMARNKALNYLSKAARNKQVAQQLWLNLSAAGPIDPAELLNHQESQRLIQEARGRLSVQKRIIFDLSRQEGLMKCI